ncbi:MAG TPA: TonB-dependent receptor, partial [Sediminibacterium sp.]|nr:TonB-dependent receptor [Sediminibacterium sp.]
HPVLLKGFSFDNAWAMVYGYNKDQAYQKRGVEGEYLPLIPPLKWVSSIRQNAKTKSKIFTEIAGKIEAEYNAAQNRFLSLYHTETATPSYTLWNVSMSTSVKFAKTNSLQVQLQVNNLFDKAYQSNLSRLKYFEYYTHSTSGHSGIYNMGRNVCIKVIMPF